MFSASALPSVRQVSSFPGSAAVRLLAVTTLPPSTVHMGDESVFTQVHVYCERIVIYWTLQIYDAKNLKNRGWERQCFCVCIFMLSTFSDRLGMGGIVGPRQTIIEGFWGLFKKKPTNIALWLILPSCLKTQLVGPLNLVDMLGKNQKLFEYTLEKRPLQPIHHLKGACATPGAGTVRIYNIIIRRSSIACYAMKQVHFDTDSLQILSVMSKVSLSFNFSILGTINTTFSCLLFSINIFLLG